MQVVKLFITQFHAFSPCDNGHVSNPLSSNLLIRLKSHASLFFSFYSKNPEESLPTERTFKIPNSEKVTEEGKKTPSKFRNITLRRFSDEALSTELYTATGWPSVSGNALKILAGKVSAEFDDFTDDPQSDTEVVNDFETMPHEENRRRIIHECANMSDYGTALKAFKLKEEGMEACHAIAALCEICSIDSLISNFILPLQVKFFCEVPIYAHL